MNNSFKITKEYANVVFKNNEEKGRQVVNYKFKHYGILHRLLNFMKDRGFKITRDPKIVKRYKSISQDYFYGKKGNLEFKAQRYPAGFEIQFFQNINYENPNVAAFNKMPYIVKLKFLNETKYIRNFLIELGVIEEVEEIYILAEDKIKEHYVESCYHSQKDMNFKLADLDGKTCSGYRNNIDRDGKIICNGQIKYFRHYRNGKLCRGKVYSDLLNMWWIILSDTEYTNVASYDLFDATSEDFKIRRKKR